MPTVDPTLAFQSALLTATYAIPNATDTPAPSPIAPLPSATTQPDPSPIPNLTPPPLPPVYTSDTLKPGDTPHIYITDTCTYLKNRWDPNKAVPGTVVMPIMFHSVTDGNVIHPDQISVETFKQLMTDLKNQGFEAIDTQQLMNFMENNAPIPKRSVILIVDDRKRSQYFDVLFKPYYEKNKWKVVNAWISAEDTPPYLWDENKAVEEAGYVDHQAHGVIHNINATQSSSDEFLKKELLGSIQAIQQHFSKTPVAYIWPGGSFTKHSVELARAAGYHLGFTINPRGPLMFNWVPQADAPDPSRPSFLPEGQTGDPLLTLPRYWDTDASYHIDEVRQVGKEAAAQAAASRETELSYYNIVCKNQTGEIPTKTP
jgi:hypothetical protein